MTTEPELTNWLAAADQRLWFDRFAVQCDRTAEPGKIQALKFQHFQLLLKASLYDYFKKFPPSAPSLDARPNGHRDQFEPPADQQAGEHRLKKAMVSLSLSERAADSGSDSFTKQQEMRLFRRFDLNNDHLLEWDEFVLLCQRWLHPVFSPVCGLVIVDVQNDFIDGSLALINGPAKQDGAEVIPVVNRLVENFQDQKATIVYTLDWHPQDHVSFHANVHLRKHTIKQPPGETRPAGAANGHAGDPQNDEREFKYKKFAPDANLFDTVLFDEGRVEQKLWPIHCVRNSWGAQFHPNLVVVQDAIRVQKGTLPDVDSYSAFWDNMRLNETGLRQELVNKHVTDLFFCGLATDYCVAASALDAIKAGFITFVVDDACRGIDEGEIEKRRQELVDNGGFIVDSDLALCYLKRSPADGVSSRQHLSRPLIKTITYRKAFC